MTPETLDLCCGEGRDHVAPKKEDASFSCGIFKTNSVHIFLLSEAF